MESDGLFQSSVKPESTSLPEYLTNVLYVVDNCKWKWNAEEEESDRLSKAHAEEEEGDKLNKASNKKPQLKIWKQKAGT